MLIKLLSSSPKFLDESLSLGQLLESLTEKAMWACVRNGLV